MEDIGQLVESKGASTLLCVAWLAISQLLATGRNYMKSTWIRSVVLGVTACCLSGAMVAQDNSADKKFVADAEQGSLFEVNLAKLALQKTGDPNVKMFAERMVKDHTMLIEDMKPLGRKMGVKTPTGPSIADRA
jgi:putative membrane protein